MERKFISPLVLLSVIAAAIATAQDFAQPYGIVPSNDVDNVSTIQQQILKQEEWLKWRKQHVVPEIMRRVGVDMWLISRADRALYYSLVPANYEGLVTEGRDALLFHNDGDTITEGNLGRDDLAEVVLKHNPKKIGVSEATRARFVETLGDELADRFFVTRDLEMGFLESRTPEEISVFHHVNRVTHNVIAEAFSNEVIIPDVTTTDEVNWWIRQRYRNLGLETSWHPTITLQRSKRERPKYDEDDEHFRIDVRPRNGYNKIIRRGDIVSVDTGIVYYGLGTDVQQNAYVLLPGETDVPEGLKIAFNNTNRLQIHIKNAFKVGKPANDLVNAALRAAWDDGLRPSIYGHPIPYHLLRYGSNGGFHKIDYEFGPYLGGGELIEPAPIQPKGGYAVYANTVFSMEIHTWTAVPEWGGQDVRIVMEEDFAMTKDGFEFLGGRQTKWYIIK